MVALLDYIKEKKLSIIGFAIVFFFMGFSNAYYLARAIGEISAIIFVAIIALFFSLILHLVWGAFSGLFGGINKFLNKNPIKKEKEK